MIWFAPIPHLPLRSYILPIGIFSLGSNLAKIWFLIFPSDRTFCRSASSPASTTCPSSSSSRCPRWIHSDQQQQVQSWPLSAQQRSWPLLAQQRSWPIKPSSQGLDLHYSILCCDGSDSRFSDFGGYGPCCYCCFKIVLKNRCIMVLLF